MSNSAVWLAFAWSGLGLAVAAWSYAKPRRPDHWRPSFVIIVFFWPLAFIGRGVELFEAWCGSASKTNQRLSQLEFKNLVLIDNWLGALAAIITALIVSFFIYGFWWPYWRIADMDFWMIYEAWLFNDGLPQEYFDHPGYFSIYLLGNWFHLLHALGLLDVYTLSGLPSLPQETEPAWTAAARAGRVLSLLLAVIYVLAFASLLKRITRDWRIAVLAAFALTFSGGLAMSSRIMRTELLAGGAVTIALLILIIAARSPASNWRPILVGLAAFCATLGLINKVQVIYLIVALPITIFPFGVPSNASGNFWRHSPTAIAAALLIMTIAILAAIPASHLVIVGLEGASSNRLWNPFLFDIYGAYQAMIFIWIGAFIIFFAIWWRVSAVETFGTAMSVLAGVAFGLLTLKLRYNVQNVYVVTNPLEQLMFWAKITNPATADISAVINEFLYGLRVVLVTRSFIFDTTARPTIFLEWFVIAATILASRAGERTLVIQIAMLMLSVWCMDAISAIRGLKEQYFILTDPFVIIAAALLLAHLPLLKTNRWTVPVGILLMSVHVAISQAEPIKHSFLTSKPMSFCVSHFFYTKRIERFSFCPPS